MRATTLERIAVRRRLGPTLVLKTLLGVGWATTAVAAGAPATAPAPKVAKKKKKKKETAPTSEPASDKPETVVKRRHVSADPAYLVGDSDPHLINQNAPKIVAFPHEQKAVEKAFS